MCLLFQSLLVERPSRLLLVCHNDCQYKFSYSYQMFVIMFIISRVQEVRVGWSESEKIDRANLILKGPKV